MNIVDMYAEMAGRLSALQSWMFKQDKIGSRIVQRPGDCPVLRFDQVPFEVVADPSKSRFDIWMTDPDRASSDVKPMRFGLTRDQVLRLVQRRSTTPGTPQPPTPNQEKEQDHD